MARPFRFGVSVRRAQNRREWQEKARRAEALGYSSFLVPDHLVDILPPLVPLVSAAEATDTLRVGTFVLNPVQKPRPPLLIGGNSQPLLTLAAREADIVSFVGFSHRRGGRDFDLRAFTDAGTEERVTIVREVAGDRFARLELNAVVQQIVVNASPRRAAEEFARDSPLSVDDVLSSPYVRIGSLDAIAEAVSENRERHGFSYWVVFEDSMDAFAPVVSQLAGS